MNIYFRRSWWKPWNWSTRTWMCVIVFSVCCSPLMIRWASLWRVPDVSLPFDVETVIQAELPDDQDAFNRYAVAMRLARRQFRSWSTQAIDDAFENPRLKWDDRLDDWLSDNRYALAEYRQASLMELAGGPSMKTADFMTILTLHNDFRYLSKLCEAEAARCERNGDLEAAWNWHLSNFRCAIHAQRPGFPICRMVGNAVRGNATVGMARWAAEPSLTAAQLRSARMDIAKQLSRRMPMSEIAKAEYLSLRNTLRRSDWPNLAFTFWNSPGPSGTPILIGKNLILWTIGEPETSMRLARQILLNSADQIDKPLYLRRKRVGSKQELIFELNPDSRKVSGQLAPAKLDAALDAFVPKLLNKSGIRFGINSTDTACLQDDARGEALMLLLACHEYQRTYGQFPKELDDLAPEIIEAVPFDPMDATPHPMHYRLEESGDAVVWSVGRNGIDDGGDIETENRQDNDCGIRIILKR